MNRPIYLRAIAHHTEPETGGKKPRDRYVQYVRDLYNLYPGAVSEESFLEGSQLTYAELGDHLFEKSFDKAALQALDLMIVAHWSQEFDPDYASCGPYFLNRYEMSSDIFDVCDQGSLAPFMALHLMQRYQASGESNNGMVLCLEQTTVPRDKTAGDIIPTQSGAVALSLNTEKSHGAYGIIDSGFITESEALSALSDPIALLTAKGLLNETLSADTQWLFRKNTSFWKTLHHQQCQGESAVIEKNCHFTAPHPGCLSTMIKLQTLMAKQHSKHIIVVDEDVESLNLAYLVLERSDD